VFAERFFFVYPYFQINSILSIFAKICVGIGVVRV